MEQAIIYLIDNSIKFRKAENAFLHLKVSCSQIDDTRVNLEFDIIDNGIGISKEFIPHLFDGFKKEISDASSDLHGFGVGMYITKSIINQLEGTIDVKSRKNVGTNITIKVPMEISKMKDTENYSIFKCKRVLTCEDNKINAKILKKILESEGMVVDVAENGLIGVNMFNKNHYDIVLMDIRMAVMDGYEAAREIRKVDKLVPIVAVSANALDSDIKKTIESGMNDHVAKPINKEHLFNIMKLHLQHSQNRDMENKEN